MTTEIDGIIYWHTAPSFKGSNLPMGAPRGDSYRCRVQPLIDIKTDIGYSEEDADHEDCVCGFAYSSDTSSGDRFAWKVRKIVCTACYTKHEYALYYAIYPDLMKCGHPEYADALQDYIDNLPEPEYGVGIYNTTRGD
jgi:hypothetical protein